MTAQKNALGNFGYEVIESDDRKSAEILLMAPGIYHEKCFTINGYTQESSDCGARFTEGDSVNIDFDLHWFDCESIQGLFDFIFEHRYDCVRSEPLKNEIGFSATWDILHEKHNNTNWLEDLDLYQVSINNGASFPIVEVKSGETIQKPLAPNSHQATSQQRSGYYRDGQLFSYFEYVGNDFEADMAKIAADPKTLEWWKACTPDFDPYEPGEYWSDMEEVFYLA